MTNIDASSLLPSIDSFQSHIPLTSTPKRSDRSHHSQPLSSTLSTSSDVCKQFELSISAITVTQKSSVLSCPKQHQSTRGHRRRQSHHHTNPSTIIKRIELKYLLFSTQAMKRNKQRQFTDSEMKIYVV